MCILIKGEIRDIERKQTPKQKVPYNQIRMLVPLGRSEKMMWVRDFSLQNYNKGDEIEISVIPKAWKSANGCGIDWAVPMPKQD